MLFDTHTHLNNDSFTDEERVALAAEIEASDVGLVMDVRIGDFVKQGDPLATLHLNRMELAEGAIARMQQAVRLTSEKPATPPLVYAAVSPEGVAR